MKHVEEKDKKSVHKEKPRAFTPITSKFNPKVCSASKISKLHPNYGNDTSTSTESLLSSKSASALKASQAEFRDREKRRQDKERDALRKRQAQTEEKRKKHEEKQQKVQQQQREILKKEKLKYLEAQYVKEEKYRRTIAEREEKLLRQKEEAENKRLGAKKKAHYLLKDKEEVNRTVEQKIYAEMKAAHDKQVEMAQWPAKQKMEGVFVVI